MQATRLQGGRPGVTRRAAAAVVALACLLMAGPGQAAISASDPKTFVQEIGERTVQILREDGTDQQKLQQLKQVLDQATDLDLVGRLVMGRSWRQASAEQQAEYLRLFRALVMQTMAERFSWYTGETFEIVGAKPVDDRDTMVSTRILRPGGKPPILVDWRVRHSERGYLLIDIVAEGVSLVVTQRSEAAEIINRNGIDGLLQEMRARLAKRDAPTGT